MTNHEIIKQFLGDEYYYLSVNFVFSSDEVSSKDEAYREILNFIYNEENEVFPNSVYYDTDWNLLMSAVGFIMSSEEYIGNPLREAIADVVPYGVMPDVVDAVVQFIKSLKDAKKGS